MSYAMTPDALPNNPTPIAISKNLKNSILSSPSAGLVFFAGQFHYVISATGLAPANQGGALLIHRTAPARATAHAISGGTPPPDTATRFLAPGTRRAPASLSSEPLPLFRPCLSPAPCAAGFRAGYCC